MELSLFFSCLVKCFSFFPLPPDVRLCFPVLSRPVLCSAELCLPGLIFVAECICWRIHFKLFSEAGLALDDRKSFSSSCPLLRNSGRSSHPPQAIEQLPCCLIVELLLEREIERAGSRQSEIHSLLPCTSPVISLANKAGHYVQLYWAMIQQLTITANIISHDFSPAVCRA